MKLPGPDSFSSLAFSAAESGDIASLRDQLTSGADPNEPDMFGFTPLQRAVQFDRAEMALLLLNAGADVNVATKPNKRGIVAGQTSLMTAAGSGLADMVGLLLDHGADPNLRYEDGYNALLLAAYGEHTYAARLLITAGAEVGLAEAAALREIRLVRQLLADGADVCETGVTALSWAAIMGEVEIASLLVDAGVSANAGDKWGNCPLHHAAMERRVEIMRFLLARGADPNAADARGASPLLASISPSRDCLDAVRVLLDSGADIDAASNAGYTPLILASLFGQTDVVLALLEGGANPNAFTDADEAAKDGIDSASALMLAAVNGHTEIVKELLRFGADVNATGSSERTALDSVEARIDRPPGQAKKAEIAAMLRAAGATRSQSDA
jgi:uncharacterized protein